MPRPPSLVLVFGAGVALLALSPFALGKPKPAGHALAPAAPEPVARVHFLDVGQGAATLVELPCGAMLIDTGGEENKDFHSVPALTDYLDKFFARRTDLDGTIDVLLLTHPHIDHVRGAPDVLARYKVKNVVDDGRSASQDDAVVAMGKVHDFLLDHPDVGHQVVTLPDIPDSGAFTSPILDPFPSCKGVDPEVRALWGASPHDPGWGTDNYGHQRFDNDNNHSIVTRLDFGKASLLVTGDLEEVAIGAFVHARSAALLDVDVYEVGHHGSHNGTTRELMDAMTPKFAVMEVGPASRMHSWTAWAYGHPRQPTIDLLTGGVTGTRNAVVEQIGTAVKTFTSQTIEKAIYATGWDGTVVLEAHADGTIGNGTPDVVRAPPDSPAP